MADTHRPRFYTKQRAHLPSGAFIVLQSLQHHTVTWWRLLLLGAQLRQTLAGSTRLVCALRKMAAHLSVTLLISSSLSPVMPYQPDTDFKLHLTCSLSSGSNRASTVTCYCIVNEVLSLACARRVFFLERSIRGEYCSWTQLVGGRPRISLYWFNTDSCLGGRQIPQLLLVGVLKGDQILWHRQETGRWVEDRVSLLYSSSVSWGIFISMETGWAEQESHARSSIWLRQAPHPDARRHVARRPPLENRASALA